MVLVLVEVWSWIYRAKELAKYHAFGGIEVDDVGHVLAHVARP
jgi:hypothetical protein